MELKTLPDVAGQKTSNSQNLDLGISWVGMSAITLPVKVGVQTWPAQISCFVNLKPGLARGIHMSRLYSLLTQALTTQELNWELLEKLSSDFVISQNGLSDQARLVVNLQWPLRRQALKSDLSGWRMYPVTMEVMRSEKQVVRTLSSEVIYSSTCPNSTALSREVWKDSFHSQFLDGKFETQTFIEWVDGFSGMPATPHAQRSRAEVRLSWESGPGLGAEDLINSLEGILTTPVQTAVKRVDEQEFARLNGENPMFCEDAARRVQGWLDSLDYVKSYRGYFEHQESLHAHNAVAEIVKNSPDA